MKENNNQIKIGAILSYAIIIVNMLIGVLYTPILTAKLGQSEYGLYSLVTSVISYLTILDFGFGNAIIIYTTKYRVSNQKDKEERLHGMFFLIYILIGIVAGIIGAILWANVDTLFGSTMSCDELRKAKILMGILTLNLAVTFPLSIFSSIITAYEKFIFSKVLNLVRIALNPIVMLMLLNLGYKSVALVVLNTIFNLGTLIINYFYCKRKLNIKLKFGKLDMSLLKEITAYSVWIFLNSIMDKINWNVDQFILGTICGTTVVAIYSVAGQLNQMYLNFSTAISGVMLPKVARMEEEKASDAEFTNIFIQTGRIQYIIMTLIMSGFLLYGQEFINILWVGPEYSQSYVIACILMLPLTIPLIQNVGLNIIQAKNQYKFRVIVLFIFSIFNLVISTFLSKLYGGIGAAIGTAISITLGQIIFMNIFYYKKTHIDIPKFWKNILKMSMPIVVVFVIAIGIKKISPISTGLDLAVQILIYTIIYTIMMWKWGINQYEKDLFMKPMKKLLKRNVGG